MKIISYNVNGIRAAIKKDWVQWLAAAKPDIICLQETKAMKEQVELEEIEALGYKTYWYSAEKKGYSGVAIFTLEEPIRVVEGCGMEAYDAEGRIIRADYKDFSVISAYFPSGTTGGPRQDFKMRFLADFQTYIDELKKEIPNLIIAGDYNICHKAIDIHNPVSNKNSSGFLPEERAWVDEFVDSGFIDSFRFFNEEPHHYSWWTYRANARARNLGWRIDYHMVSAPLEKNLKNAYILPEAKHSDHCPVVVELDI